MDSNRRSPRTTIRKPSFLRPDKAPTKVSERLLTWMPIYAALVSTIALAVSATSFYFSSIRQVHSLKVGAVAFYPDVNQESGKTRVLTRFVLLNRGNRSASANQMELELRPTLDERASSGGWIASSTPGGPYILKSEEAVAVERELSFSTKDFINLAEWHVVDGHHVGSGFLYLTAEALLPNGKTHRTRILLAKVEYVQKTPELLVRVFPWFFDHFTELISEDED